MKKRLLASLLSLVMVLTMLPSAALAAEENTSGGISWSISEDTLTISANSSANSDGYQVGEMPDYSYSTNTSPWESSASSISKVIIEAGVRNIGAYAFYNCTNLEEIQFTGDGLLTVGTAALAKCPALETIVGLNCHIRDHVIYDSVNDEAKVIGYTDGISTKVELPDTVTEIGAASFNGCTTLKEIDLGDNVSVIGRSAFNACSSLSEVTFPDTLKQIDDWAFNATSLNALNLKEGVQSIGVGAFQAISFLESVVLPNSISEIGGECFARCPNLKEITFPSGLKEIQQSMCIDCKALESVVLNGGLEKIGTSAFRNCEKLAEVILPESIVEIGPSAFYGCKGLKYIYIPSKVTTIGTSALMEIASYSEPFGIFLSSEHTKNLMISQTHYNDQRCYFVIAEDGKFSFGSEGTLPTSTKEGFIFEGWYAQEKDGSLEENKATQFEVTKTYFAKWTLADPTVTVTTEKTHIASGETAILTASAEHELDGVTYEYQWYTGTPDSGSEIPGATSATYTVSSLGTATSYYCKVTAVSGSDKSEAVTSSAVTITPASSAGSVVITNSTTSATYGDDPFTFTYTASGTANVKSSETSVATVSDNNGTVTVTIVGAGTTEISVNFPGSTDHSTASASFTLTVNKAALTITADNKSVYVGDSMPAFTYTVSGLVGTDTLATQPTLFCDTNSTSTAGTYTITPSGADAGDNYTINYVNGTLTVSRRSSGGGGGGSTTYTVSVDAGRNGDVTVSPSRASYGDTVTITVDPDTGYELDELIVTDSDGDEISVRSRGDGRYTFTMPRGRVTIEATFVEIAEDPDLLTFTDVPASAYYYDAVYWAVENGVTNGTSASTFSPNASCTRAQMVTFLWRAAGSPEPESTVNPFTDVSASAYYYDAVLWAVEQGITNGTSATTFGPDATVTRGQTVTFLWRYDGSPAVSGSGFDDVVSDAYYADAVAWAAGEGVTSGTSATTFSPSNDCTRGQIVTFLYRYMA